MTWIKYTDEALKRAKGFVAASEGAPMAIRITAEKANAQALSYAFGLDPIEEERGGDMTIRTGTLITRLDRASAKWLKGATIDWLVKDEQEGFAVANPQDYDDMSDEGVIRQKIIEELKTIYDPEIPVNIYELGLIYRIDVDLDHAKATVIMTLTTPNCPVAEELPQEVKAKAASVMGIEDAEVELTWEPPWSMDQMSEAARLQLNI